MATRMQQRRGTAAQWTAANSVLAAGEIGFETDTGKFKIGDGTNTWANLSYFQDTTDLSGSYIPLSQKGANSGVATLDAQGKIPVAQLGNVIDGAPGVLDTLNELAAAINDDAAFLTTLAPKAGPTFTGTVVLPSTTSIGDVSSTELGYVNGVTSAIQTQIDSKAATGHLHTISNVSGLQDALDAKQAVVGDVSSTEIGYLDGVTSAIQTQLNNKSPINSPTFTGNVVLPSSTTIGDLSSAEIGYLATVSSNVQTQLDAKLDSATASTTYATLAGPTFTGTVVLPNTTSIGTVDATELSYVNGVTSAIQTQLDAKAPTANPTFTGTVAGVTKAHVGLGNVDNTTDANKPVSTATQTALDAKLALAGGTMIGKIVLDGDPTEALHPATKQYVDNVSAGLHIHEAVHAATTGTLAAMSGGSVTYNNGTSGVGATLTLGTALTTIDGFALTNGDRILVKNEATAAHNGVYTRTSSTVLTRATDFDSAAEMAGGDFTFVENGTLYNSTGWVVENEVNTVGTDAVLFAQFSGAGTVTAGTNISVSGLQVSVVNAPTFSGLVTASATGVAFSDGTQTKVGVPSITTISQKTDSYTLANLNERDTLVEISKSTATTLTIPTNATIAYPVGTSIDILQTGTGQVTIAGAGGVTVNATPGLKLRTQWSSATLFKRATDTWVVFGDLTA
jgi:hypothetical protein